MTNSSCSGDYIEIAGSGESEFILSATLVTPGPSSTATIADHQISNLTIVFFEKTATLFQTRLVKTTDIFSQKLAVSSDRMSHDEVTNKSAPPPKIVRPWELSPVKTTRPAACRMARLSPVTNNPAATSPSTTRASDTSPSLSFPMYPSPPPDAVQPEQDSGYFSPCLSSPHPSPPIATYSLGGDEENRKTEPLPQVVVDVMKGWYQQHFDHPYPDHSTTLYFARVGGISLAQVKKWFANKRVRTMNTLSFNGAMHPRRLSNILSKRSRTPSARSKVKSVSNKNTTSPVDYKLPVSGTEAKTNGFKPTALDTLNSWFVSRQPYPYPSLSDLNRLSRDTDLSCDQVLQWIATRRCSQLSACRRATTEHLNQLLSTQNITSSTSTPTPPLGASRVQTIDHLTDLFIRQQQQSTPLHQHPQRLLFHPYGSQPGF